VEEPCRWVAGVVLLRWAAEEVQLQTPEEAEEAHLDLPMTGRHPQKHCKVLGQRLCFCAAMRVGAVAAVLPVEGVLHRQPMAQQPTHLQKTSDRSAGR
jgi:hypothetical protein